MFMPSGVARIALCGLWLAQAAAFSSVPGMLRGTAAPAAATRRPTAARSGLRVYRIVTRQHFRGGRVDIGSGAVVPERVTRPQRTSSGAAVAGPAATPA